VTILVQNLANLLNTRFLTEKQTRHELVDSNSYRTKDYKPIEQFRGRMTN